MRYLLVTLALAVVLVIARPRLYVEHYHDADMPSYYAISLDIGTFGLHLDTLGYYAVRLSTYRVMSDCIALPWFPASCGVPRG